MRVPERADGRRAGLLDSTSSTERLLAGARIGPLAFAGIVPVSVWDLMLFVVRVDLSCDVRDGRT